MPSLRYSRPPGRGALIDEVTGDDRVPRPAVDDDLARHDLDAGEASQHLLEPLARRFLAAPLAAELVLAREHEPRLRPELLTIVLVLTLAEARERPPHDPPDDELVHRYLPLEVCLRAASSRCSACAHQSARNSWYAIPNSSVSSGAGGLPSVSSGSIARSCSAMLRVRVAHAPHAARAAPRR